MKKPLRIAVIGAGLIGKVHVTQIEANADCIVAAIADPTPAGKAFTQVRNIAWFATLDELLAVGQVDGVILATPNKLHSKQTQQCIAAGIPTLIEKPVAHTLEEGKRLLSIAEASDVPLMVGHHRAHSPIMSKAREAINSGALGDLVAVTGSAMFYKPADYFEAGPWRTQLGGGPILINMIHEIGNLRYLCGEITAVQAIASSARRGYEVEDTVGILMRFENGVVGTFILSDTAASARSWEQTSQENKDYSTYPDEDCYHVTGTMGSLSIPTMRLKQFASEGVRSWYEPFVSEEIALEREDPLAVQLKHFCQVINGEVNPLVSVRDGLQNLRVTEAILEAAKSERIVRID
jgi:predicted dehydrogenase